MGVINHPGVDMFMLENDTDMWIVLSHGVPLNSSCFEWN